MKPQGSLALLLLALAAAPASAQQQQQQQQQQRAPELSAPVRLEAGGAPINVEVGHAAPFVHDLDGDGAQDLLVGQFGQGKLRLYRNEGTAEAPRLAASTWVQAGGQPASTEAG